MRRMVEGSKRTYQVTFLSYAMQLSPWLLWWKSTDLDTRTGTPLFRIGSIQKSIYSFCVEFIQLGFPFHFSPQADHPCLRTKSHVHQFLEPASIVDFAQNTSENDAIIPDLECARTSSSTRLSPRAIDLHEQHVACIVCSPMYNETLFL